MLKEFSPDARKMVKTILVVISIAAGIAAIIMGAPLWLAVAIGAVLLSLERWLD